VELASRSPCSFPRLTTLLWTTLLGTFMGLTCDGKGLSIHSMNHVDTSKWSNRMEFDIEAMTLTFSQAEMSEPASQLEKTPFQAERRVLSAPASTNCRLPGGSKGGRRARRYLGPLLKSLPLEQARISTLTHTQTSCSGRSVLVL